MYASANYGHQPTGIDRSTLQRAYPNTIQHAGKGQILDERSYLAQNINLPGQMNSQGHPNRNLNSSFTYNNQPPTGIQQLFSNAQGLQPSQPAGASYLDSLKDQVRMKKLQKDMDKRREIEEDRKLLQEQNKYQYFGRGGGGAPLRDKSGKVITTRRPDPNDIGNLYGQHSNSTKPTDYYRSVPIPNQPPYNQEVYPTNYYSQSLKEEGLFPSQYNKSSDPPSPYRDMDAYKVAEENFQDRMQIEIKEQKLLENRIRKEKDRREEIEYRLSGESKHNISGSPPTKVPLTPPLPKTPNVPQEKAPTEPSYQVLHKLVEIDSTGIRYEARGPPNMEATETRCVKTQTKANEGMDSKWDPVWEVEIGDGAYQKLPLKVREQLKLVLDDEVHKVKEEFTHKQNIMNASMNYMRKEIRKSNNIKENMKNELEKLKSKLLLQKWEERIPLKEDNLEGDGISEMHNNPIYFELPRVYMHPKPPPEKTPKQEEWDARQEEIDERKREQQRNYEKSLQDKKYWELKDLNWKNERKNDMLDMYLKGDRAKVVKRFDEELTGFLQRDHNRSSKLYTTPINTRLYEAARIAAKAKRKNSGPNWY